MAATYDFSGKTVVVTGAGNGIGKVIVQKLVKYGANVVAVSLLQAELDALVTELPQVKPVQADVTDWSGMSVLTTLGPIHGLVNNAGIMSVAPFLNVTKEQIDQSFSVNVSGIINVSQAVVKNMLANNIKGAIVNLSSIASKVATPGGTVYSASKAAVQSVTSTMALELGKAGIRVNSVQPTVVRTNMTERVWNNEQSAAKFLARTPLARFAEKEEVADGVLFLLSDQASMVTGAGLPIDGGFLV